MTELDDSLDTLRESTAKLTEATERLKSVNEFASKPWPERTCSPAKRKVRQALIAVGNVLAALFLVACVVIVMISAWYEPKITGIVFGLALLITFLQWATLDDSCDKS